MRKLVLCMTELVVVISLFGVPGAGWGAKRVMPTLLPAPPGKLTIVNNCPGDQTDPTLAATLSATPAR